MNIDLFYQSEATLGEGPVWDHNKGELSWVDIENGQLHFFNPTINQHQQHTFDSRLGAAVPSDNEKYLLALQKGLAFFDPTSEELKYFSNPEEALPNNRFNDGKCDPQGRFWIGSMDCNAESGQGILYRIDSDLKVNALLPNLSISNGLAWHPEKNVMYFIDSATYKVLQFDYTPSSGSIKNPKEVIRIPEDHGAPDGMTIDREGMLWIAHWGGANISRWNPETGRLLQKVTIPALHVTSCCFGGENYDQLFITTARYGLTDEQMAKYPLSGSIFSCKPKVGGWAIAHFKMG
ncbi:MAG: SMP-30/gluconolactonase/LRE family protein [Bacteroidota bacterium]